MQECYRAAGVDLTEDLNRIGAPIKEYITYSGAGDITSREPTDTLWKRFGRRSYDVCRPELMEILLAKFVSRGGQVCIRALDRSPAPANIARGCAVPRRPWS
jgi:hypothetical protein